MPDESVPDMEPILTVISAALAILMLTWLLRQHWRNQSDQGFSFRIFANFDMKLILPWLVFKTGYF